MRRMRIAGCFVGLVAYLVTAGCGGTGGSSATTAGGPAPAGAGNIRRAIHEPVQSRGIKGEDPEAEAATTLAISGSDCAALKRLAEERLGHGGGPVHLSAHSTPKPPLSRCRLSGPRAQISIYLDSGFAAHQRYNNRIEETVQFNTENPAGLPQAVPRVGEKAAYNADANWIPALGSLLALRGNRWLTVTISVPGRSRDERRDEAAALARAGFKLTAR